MTKLQPHAEITATGQDGLTEFKSKKALRDALADAPGFVQWRVVGTVTTGFQDQRLTTAELVEAIDGSALVVGPNPKQQRNYYGTVTVKAGRIVVK